MAKTNFSLKPFVVKDSGLLTGFQAPKTAASSQQISPQEMVRRQEAIKKTISKAGATISSAFPKPTPGPAVPVPGPSVYDYGTPGTPGYIPAQITPAKKKTSPGSAGSFSQQFAGPGGNVALGQGTNVNNQATATATLSQQATAPTAPTAEPVITPTAESAGAGTAGAGTGASVGGNVGAGAGGYTPGGFSTIQEGIDTSQPSPETVRVGSQASKFEQGFDQAQADTGYTKDAQGNVFNAQGEQMTLEQGKPNSLPLGPDGKPLMNLENLPAGRAQAMVQQYAPSDSNSVASSFVQQDPFIGGLVTAWQEHINPVNQRKSLVDTYAQMTKDSGVEALDMELLNSKRIIEGSEEDIRREITASGSGFATESQIIALAASRNRSLIKNYLTLLETRNAKEKYLQTALQLESQDRQAADQRFESLFSMGIQIANLRQQMQRDSVEAYDRIVKTVGYDGLFDMTQNDPYAVSVVERTLRLPSGGLISAANQAQLAKARAEEERQLGLEEKQLGLIGKQLDIALKRKELDKPLPGQPGGGKPISSSTALQIADSKAAIDMLSGLDDVIRTNADKFGPIKGRLAGLNPYDVAAQNVQSQINSTKQIVGKFLEGGVLRKEDEEKYEKILPTLKDTSEVATKKLNNVRNLVQLKISSQQETLSAAGYNPAITSGNIIVGPDGQEYEITN